MKICVLYIAAVAASILLGIVVCRCIVILVESSDEEIQSIVRSCFELAGVVMSTLYLKNKLS